MWITDVPLSYVTNHKGGTNLLLGGYRYRKEAAFKTSTNWVCSRSNGRTIDRTKCMARCVTRSTDGSIRLNKHRHTHGPD